LTDESHPLDSVDKIMEAARRGDGAALNQLALWRVFGEPLRRDFKLARDLFRRSGEAGHIGAALTHAVFVAIGAGGPSDWQAAIQLVGEAAKTDAVAARQKALLDLMALSSAGMPLSSQQVVPIARSPKMFFIPQLLTAAECSHVRSLARPLLAPSVVVDPQTGHETAHPIRTSAGAVLGPVQMDLVVEALNRRIASVTGTAVEQGEPLTVLHYSPGQEYRLHHDCLPSEANQRQRTLIVFLNEEFEGGETYFPKIDVRIRASTGDAIVFDNVGADGRPDEDSRHAGLPVTSGEKWICTRWFRSHPFDPWGMRCG
jgi:prolyl 4-hydroxylase